MKKIFIIILFSIFLIGGFIIFSILYRNTNTAQTIISSSDPPYEETLPKPTETMVNPDAEDMDTYNFIDLK